MKRIINGKRYDTETAKRICYIDNGRSDDDFGFRDYALYKTKSGAYFLKNRGGPASDMAVSYGRETTGSSTIKPMTEDEARAWLMMQSSEKNEGDATDALETYFAEAITDA